MPADTGVIVSPRTSSEPQLCYRSALLLHLATKRHLSGLLRDTRELSLDPLPVLRLILPLCADPNAVHDV